MAAIGSSLTKVQSSLTAGIDASADVTDDGAADVGASEVASGPVDSFEPAATPKLSLSGGAPASLDVPALAPKGFSPVHVDVPWKSQDMKSPDFDAEANGNCNRTAKAMIAATVAPESGGAAPDGADGAYRMGRATASGRLEVDPAQARQARAYLDSQLDQGLPVMVGVDRKDGSKNPDGVTDHFVVVTGRGVDDEGRVFYTFHDPAARKAANGSDANPNNRFFVDQRTGALYRDGTDGNQSKLGGKDNPNYRQRYEVSEVRQNGYVSRTLPP